MELSHLEEKGSTSVSPALVKLPAQLMGEGKGGWQKEIAFWMSQGC